MGVTTRFDYVICKAMADRDKQNDEKQRQLEMSLRADLDFLAMMTDIDLDEGVEEVDDNES